MTLFRPTKGKVITSVLLTLIWWAFRAFFAQLDCAANCAEVLNNHFPEIIQVCCAQGISGMEFFMTLLEIIIVPFVTIYIVYSLIAFFRSK